MDLVLLGGNSISNKKMKVKNYQLAEIPGSDHDYDDLKQLEKIIREQTSNAKS